MAVRHVLPIPAATLLGLEEFKDPVIYGGSLGRIQLHCSGGESAHDLTGCSWVTPGNAILVPRELRSTGAGYAMQQLLWIDPPGSAQQMEPRLPREVAG